jgi:hypothetical protein
MRIESIKNNIYAYLITISDLIAIVPAGQIGWVDVDENTDFPRIVFRMISSPPLYQSDDQWQRWRFFCRSDSKVECENIGEILIENLNRLQGDMGGKRMSYVAKIDENEATWQDNIYEKYVDFRFVYNNS